MTVKPEDSIVGNAKKADAVAVAKVRAVGAPPPVWSGTFAAYQQVHYQIVRWLRKPSEELKGDTIIVFHPVVAKSLTADAHRPRLREDIFRVGSELILFLKQKDSRFETLDENHGVVPSDPKTVEAVTHALEQRPPQPLPRE